MRESLFYFEALQRFRDESLECPEVRPDDAHMQNVQIYFLNFPFFISSDISSYKNDDETLRILPKKFLMIMILVAVAVDVKG